MPLRTALCSKRSSLKGARGSGRTGSATRSTGSSSPVNANRGSHTSSCWRNWTVTSCPICTSDGSQSTMFVVRWTRGSSVNATLAMTYGGSKSGNQRWALSVKPTIVPRPDIGAGFDDRLRQ